MKDLYLLADGTYADPKDTSKGDDGVLRHKNGVHVALRDDGSPYTLSGHAEASGNAAAADLSETPAESVAAEQPAPEAKPDEPKAT